MSGGGPTREAARVPAATAQAAFVTRELTLGQRTWMAALDVAIAVLRPVLRLGGRPLADALAGTFGSLAWALSSRKRAIARVNLDLAFGDAMPAAEKRRVSRAMYVHFARLGIDFIFDELFWPPDELVSRVRVEGFDVIDRCLEQGRGFLGISGHIGNWEMMCATAAAHGYEFYGIFKRTKNPWIDRFIGEKRLRYGMSLLEIPIGARDAGSATDARPVRGSLRDQIEEQWRRNVGVAYLCDQYAHGRAVRAPFLGVEDTPTSAGALAYAVANRVPLTFHYCVYTPGGGLHYRIEGPVEIEEQPGGHEATVEHYTRVVNDWLSAKIREVPEQWTWGHRRFERHHYPKKRRR